MIKNNPRQKSGIIFYMIILDILFFSAIITIETIKQVRTLEVERESSIIGGKEL